MQKTKIWGNTALPKSNIQCRIFFKIQKTEPFFRLIFSRSENVFFNFDGTVFCGNRCDKGILNFRPLMYKSTDIPLRGVLSKRLGICSISFPKTDGKLPKKAHNHDLAILNRKVKISLWHLVLPWMLYSQRCIWPITAVNEIVMRLAPQVGRQGWVSEGHASESDKKNKGRKNREKGKARNENKQGP